MLPQLCFISFRHYLILLSVKTIAVIKDLFFSHIFKDVVLFVSWDQLLKIWTTFVAESKRMEDEAERSTKAYNLQWWVKVLRFVMNLSTPW